MCYRVRLRGLAQRLCLPWIPGAVEIPQQPTTTPHPHNAGQRTPHWPHLHFPKKCGARLLYNHGLLALISSLFDVYSIEPLKTKEKKANSNASHLS